MLTIGCHMSTRDGYEAMAKEAVSIDANTLQYFTRNPRGGAQRALDQQDIEAFNTFAKQHDIVAPMGYAPYDLEPAQGDQSKQDFACMVMLEDLKRLALMPGSRYLLRPGSAGDTPKEEALKNVAGVLNKVLESGSSVPVLLVNMPGEGTQVGCTFEEIATILDNAPSANVGFCLDAASAYAMGYDIVNDLDGVLQKIDAAIGMDKLLAIHLNDIKEPLGSHADRHARIGEGEIGLTALKALTQHPKLKELPFYLEEPEATIEVYKADIEEFRAGV